MASYSKIIFTDFAQTTLASGITATATTATLATGSGALFPTPSLAGQFFSVTLTDAASGQVREIVYVTALNADTVTMMRGQEGTTALAWLQGDFFANTLTAADLNALTQNTDPPFNVIAGQTRRMSGSAAASSKTAQWTCDTVIVQAALTSYGYRGNALTLNFTGTQVGANGMDTGAMPVSADLSIYVIYNPTANLWATLGTLGTTSNGTIYSGSLLPTGYSASCLLWSGVTDSFGNFRAFQQRDRSVMIAPLVLATGLTASSYTSQSLAAIVPANAGFWMPDGNETLTAASQIYFSPVASDGPGRIALFGSALGGMTGPASIISTAQVIYYRVTNGGNWSINCVGYTF